MSIDPWFSPVFKCESALDDAVAQYSRWADEQIRKARRKGDPAGPSFLFARKASSDSKVFRKQGNGKSSVVRSAFGMDQRKGVSDKSRKTRWVFPQLFVRGKTYCNDDCLSIGSKERNNGNIFGLQSSGKAFDEKKLDRWFDRVDTISERNESFQSQSWYNILVGADETDSSDEEDKTINARSEHDDEKRMASLGDVEKHPISKQHTLDQSSGCYAGLFEAESSDCSGEKREMKEARYFCSKQRESKNDDDRETGRDSAEVVSSNNDRDLRRYEISIDSSKGSSYEDYFANSISYEEASASGASFDSATCSYTSVEPLAKTIYPLCPKAGPLRADLKSMASF